MSSPEELKITLWAAVAAETRNCRLVDARQQFTTQVGFTDPSGFVNLADTCDVLPESIPPCVIKERKLDFQNGGAKFKFPLER